MNDQEREELKQLKLRQARLQEELNSLSKELTELEVRFAHSREPSPTPPKAAPSAIKIPSPPPPTLARTPAPAAAPPLPPVIPVVASQAAAITAKPVSATPSLKLRGTLSDTRFLKGVCRSCEGSVEFPDRALGETIICPHCGKETLLTRLEDKFAPRVEPISQTKRATLPVPPLVPPLPPTPVAASAEKERSFEMRLGTFWLVRIGVVMLLTGLVFFGNYAYQKVIVHIGPAGKVSLLYLASAALLGAGAWWKRRAAQASLRNFGQVLFAGGLAAVYFTTYAAHHFTHLRVIESAELDGLLLLAWAGYMVWVADRNKSEVLALFGVGLAYYTSLITRVGFFTLYSNAVLTVAAVFFLVRNRWATLSVVSLVATYFSYAFWRFFQESGWHWASRAEGLWGGTCFLISYWAPSLPRTFPKLSIDNL